MLSMNNAVNLKEWTLLPPKEIFKLSPDFDTKYELLTHKDNDNMVKIVGEELIKKYGIDFIRQCIDIGYFTHYRII